MKHFGSFMNKGRRNKVFREGEVNGFQLCKEFDFFNELNWRLSIPIAEGLEKFHFIG